jgi:cobalt-zinc-cadmium efflux system membrane fusion protein
MKSFTRTDGLCRLAAALVITTLCVALYPGYTAIAAEETDAHGEEHAGEEHADEERLALTPDQIRNAGISINQAGPAALRETLPLYGQIVPNAEREHTVSARYPGLIRQVAKKVGDAVKQGEVLATVESNESLKPYPVVASLTGVVVQRQANVGEQTGDRALFVIGDYSTVWVNLSVFPGDLTKIRAGQKVRIVSKDDAINSEGSIITVSPVGSSVNQTITATAMLDNADGRWVPGRFVRAEVVLSESEVPLAIQENAVQVVDDNPVVFVAHDGAFEVRPVELGRSDGKYSEVLAGLKAGESYVSGSSFVLKSELGKEGTEHGH